LYCPGYVPVPRREGRRLRHPSHDIRLDGLQSKGRKNKKTSFLKKRIFYGKNEWKRPVDGPLSLDILFYPGGSGGSWLIAHCSAFILPKIRPIEFPRRLSVKWFYG
jgi:hypothetical protein